jgi:hypothetical protein
VAAIGAYSEHVDSAAEATAQLAKEQEAQAKASQLQIAAALRLSQTVLRPDAGAAQVEKNRELRDALAELDKSGVGGIGRRMQREDLLAAIAKNDDAARESRFREENARNLATISAAESTFDERGPAKERKFAGLVASPKFSDGTTEAGRSEYASQMQAIQKAELDGAKRNQEMLDEQDRAAFERKKALLLKAVDADAAANAQKFASARATAAKLETLDTATVARNKQIRETGMEAFSSVATIGIQSLSKLAQGQKISGKQVIGMIGDQLVALGTKNLLEGIAMTAASLGFPTGAPLIIAGTARSPRASAWAPPRAASPPRAEAADRVEAADRAASSSASGIRAVVGRRARLSRRRR